MLYCFTVNSLKDKISTWHLFNFDLDKLLEKEETFPVDWGYQRQLMLNSHKEDCNDSIIIIISLDLYAYFKDVCFYTEKPLRVSVQLFNYPDNKLVQPRRDTDDLIMPTQYFCLLVFSLELANNCCHML